MEKYKRPVFMVAVVRFSKTSCLATYNYNHV